MPKKKATEQAAAVDPDAPLRFGFPDPLSGCGEVPDCNIHDTLEVFHYHLTKLLGYECENWKDYEKDDEDSEDTIVFRRSYIKAPPAKSAFYIYECLLTQMAAGGLTTARHILAFEPPYSGASILGIKDAAPPVFSVSFYYPDAAKLAVDVERSRRYLEEMLLACAATREPKP